MTNNSDAISVNLLRDISPNISGRSTPSTIGDNPISMGYYTLISKLGLHDVIRDTKAAVRTLMSVSTKEGVDKIKDTIINGNNQAKIDLAVESVITHCSKRLMNDMSTAHRQGIKVITDGFSELNVNLPKDHKSYVISLAEVRGELSSISTSRLVDLCLPVYERLGMDYTIQSHMQKNKEVLIDPQAYILHGDLVTNKTRYMGTSLFVAMSIAYEMYDNVDIIIFNEHLILTPSGQPVIKPAELFQQLGFNNLLHCLGDGYHIDGMVYHKEDNVFYVDSGNFELLKNAAVNTAAQGDIQETKAILMKLAYYSQVANMHVDAFNGLNQSLKVDPQDKLHTGCNLFLDASTPTSKFLARYSDDGINATAFGDVRAYMNIINRVLQIHVRSLRRHPDKYGTTYGQDRNLNNTDWVDANIEAVNVYQYADTGQIDSPVDARHDGWH